MFLRRGPKQETAPDEGAADSERDGSPESVLRDELGLNHLWYLELRLRHEFARAARTEEVFSLAAWRMRLLPGENPSPEFVGRCAELIVKSLRSYNVAARVDNERFAAILFAADYQSASTVAFRIKSDLQLRVPGASRWQAGVATFHRDGVDADSLIQTALRRLEGDARAA